MEPVIKKTEHQPLYLQMALQIEARIAAGELQPGARLPSFGQMRKEYGANQVTLERVYMVLEKKGLIRREAKRGIFVAEPRAVASPLLKVITGTFGARHEYHVRMLQGIQAEAHRHNAELLLCNEDSRLDWDRVDGVITMSEAEQVIGGIPQGMPCVAVMMPGVIKLPTVLIDDGAGIVMAVEHLVALGHRRIGYLTVEKIQTERSSPPFRLEAYRRALSAAGITADPRWERPLRESAHEPIQSFIDLGRRKMELWLDDNWAELGCTALLMQNDDTAIGAMQALDDAGVLVPEHVSVVGFDGIGAGACVRPQLTTVSVPLEEIGAAAVATVMERIRRNGAKQARGKASSIVLSPEFLIRDSTTRARDTAIELDLPMVLGSSPTVVVGIL